MLGASLAGGVLGFDRAPVFGGVVGPVASNVARICAGEAGFGAAGFLSFGERASFAGGMVWAAQDSGRERCYEKKRTDHIDGVVCMMPAVGRGKVNQQCTRDADAG